MKKIFLSLLFIVFMSPCLLAQATDKKAVESKNNLEQLKGNYVSAENPDGMLIYLNGDKLMGKVAGKASIALEHVSKNVFKSDKADVVIEFNPEEKEFTLRQNGASYTYKKE